jgi:NADPH:quinone reductase-like Zn-dependent oxidoreductase
MNDRTEFSGLELRSLITPEGELRLWLEEAPARELAADEVLVRVEATPINPSDQGLLLGPADLSTLRAGGTPERPTLTATIPEARLASVAGRIDTPLPVGNEGAGHVVAAGAEATALLGRIVATRAGGMYAHYRVAKAAECLALPDGVTAKDGASAFINPLTALGMVETMRREGHSALIHTAAASNLGQMLNRLCLADGIALVNVVRNESQAELLRQAGAAHVVDSSQPRFVDDLVEAISATGATLAFDAIGGGTLAATILKSIETVLSRGAAFDRYGSAVNKQVYIYGGLDPSPTVLDRSFGMAWGIGGWLVTWFLAKIGPQDAARLRDRVAAELTTTFASTYTAEISLVEMLSPDVVRAYAKRATGEKYLVTPSAMREP